MTIHSGRLSKEGTPTIPGGIHFLKGATSIPFFEMPSHLLSCDIHWDHGKTENKSDQVLRLGKACTTLGFTLH
jgi:hypothetical protein